MSRVKMPLMGRSQAPNLTPNSLTFIAHEYCKVSLLLVFFCVGLVGLQIPFGGPPFHPYAAPVDALWAPIERVLMHSTLTVTGRDLALELYRLLNDWQPSRLSGDQRAQLRLRLLALHERADAMARTMSTRTKARFGTPLTELSAFIAGALPHFAEGDIPGRMRWKKVHKQLQERYEALATRLRNEAVHLPYLRPRNYARNGFHIAWGITAVYLIEIVLSPIGMVWASFAFLCVAWGTEWSRRSSTFFRKVMNDGIYKYIMHVHEKDKISSATWYATALIFLSLTLDPMLCAIGCGILGLADPAAALVGRRIGRTKLVNGRSLEGTLAFVVMGTLVALFIASYFHDLTGPTLWAVSLFAAIFGGFAELYSRRVDDNFTIPLAGAAGAWIALLIW